MIPRALIHALLGWMKVRWGSQLVWQWFGMIVTRVVAAAAMLLTYQTGSGITAGSRTIWLMSSAL